MPFNRISIAKPLVVAALMSGAFSAAHAMQWEFKSSYNGGVDLILDTSAFDPVKNGWSITGAEPNAYTLFTTGISNYGYTNSNFIYNAPNGPTVTQGNNTLILNLPGGDHQPVDLWTFNQNGQFLIGPFGGGHLSAISVTAVPEPATYAMLLAGGILLGVAKSRKLRADASC